MKTSAPTFKAVLFYRTKKRTNPKAPPKTEIEAIDEFQTHGQASETAASAYDKNSHAYVGYGVMVKWGEI